MDGSALPEVRSTCPYCGVGCGVLLRANGQGGLDVRGDPDHPTNRGRLCSKGTALGETVGREGRLLAPRINGVTVDWESALDTVASRFSQTIAEHGPDSVAFYVSGQLLTEDYYVANKLMKGFIGSANIDTNSRLCMASTVAGHRRAFGSDTVPGTYEDLEQADLIVLVGSNLAWCHPVLNQRIQAARAQRPEMKLVVVDPRRTASCDGADMHLQLRNGADVALFNALLAKIDRSGAHDPEFLTHVEGAAAGFAAARSTDTSVTGLSPEQIRAFTDLWINTKRVVTVFSQGVNQSTSGSDKVNAILNCHLATGRIGQPGMGPFSVTGQPNAMGGREVGGLANMLACHLELENPAHRQVVQNYWQAPAMPSAPGLKAVDMFSAVGAGKIKALWIIHTNPAVSMPDADAVTAAIKSCDFTVVSDITGATDTARLCDVQLPATAWAEKSGTVTNSDRTISRQRAALPAPGQARPDWQILAEVGRRMGWSDAFTYASPADIFDEYAKLSGLAAAQGRDFDISGLSGLTPDGYDRLEPTRWPVSKTRQGGRFFADGQFYTPSGKAQMLALQHRAPAAKTGAQFPFRLNTGRVRDQWHSMTRTGKSPRLSAHLAEPFLEIHPQDAARQGFNPADLISVRSTQGSAILRVLITDAVLPGEVFAPIHWTNETAPSARIDALVPSFTDPVSGQPESKAAVVALSKFRPGWHGFAVSLNQMQPTTDYWALSRTTSGWRTELASSDAPEDWAAYARTLIGGAETIEQSLCDPARGTYRFAFYREGLLVGAFFAAPDTLALSRDHLADLPGTDGNAVLSGRPAVGQPDPGPIVCACYSVGRNTILTAIKDHGLSSVDAIGTALSAGTNCGSCRSELADLLPDLILPVVAA